MSTIDLSKLPPPDVVESLDFEDIYQELLGVFRVAMGDAWSAALESDPVVKLIELAAYREMLLRARINDAARACMLAYATGADLDHLAALLGVSRLVAVPANPTANPPVAAVMESDDRLRMRAQMALEGETVAGSRGSYVFHALSASALVADVTVSSPLPGDVVVTVLAATATGVPDAPLLSTVDAYLSAEDRRPLTDAVAVEAANVIPYTVSATLHCYPGPAAEPVRAAAAAAVAAYVAEHFRLGHDITLSGLYAALHQPGVQRVVLTSPAADIVVAASEAARCDGVVVVLGDSDV